MGHLCATKKKHWILVDVMGDIETTVSAAEVTQPTSPEDNSAGDTQGPPPSAPQASQPAGSTTPTPMSATGKQN